MMASMAASPALLPAAVSPVPAAGQGDRVSFPAGVQAGGDVTQPLGAGDPGGVQEGGQPEEPGDFGQPGGAEPAGVQPGQPGPARQRPGQRGGDVAPSPVGAAGDQMPAGEPRPR